MGGGGKLEVDDWEWIGGGRELEVEDWVSSIGGGGESPFRVLRVRRRGAGIVKQVQKCEQYEHAPRYDALLDLAPSRDAAVGTLKSETRFKTECGQGVAGYWIHCRDPWHIGRPLAK